MNSEQMFDKIQAERMALINKKWNGGKLTEAEARHLETLHSRAEQLADKCTPHILRERAKQPHRAALLNLRERNEKWSI